MNHQMQTNTELQHPVKGSLNTEQRTEEEQEADTSSRTANKKIYGSNEGEDAINSQRS